MAPKVLRPKDYGGSARLPFVEFALAVDFVWPPATSVCLMCIPHFSPDAQVVDDA